MTSDRRRRATLPAALWLAGPGALGLATAASAQVIGGGNNKQPGQPGAELPKELEPPIPPAPTEGPSSLFSITFAVIFLILLMIVSLIPSKRGHQD